MYPCLVSEVEDYKNDFEDIYKKDHRIWMKLIKN